MCEEADDVRIHKLWNHSHNSKLPEVIIERERPLDAEPLHDNETRAVGEAPAFVGESKENGRGLLDIVRRNSNDVAMFSA